MSSQSKRVLFYVLVILAVGLLIWGIYRAFSKGDFDGKALIALIGSFVSLSIAGYIKPGSLSAASVPSK